MTDKNGGPAFPFPSDDGPGQFPPSRGMSLRDWFAGQIVPAAIIACQGDHHSKSTYEAHCAEQAYRMADAMLSAREGGSK